MERIRNGLRKVLPQVPLVAWLVAGGVLGYVTHAVRVELRNGGPVAVPSALASHTGNPATAPPASLASAPVKAQYACSMFCVPPLDRPGPCPVCGMDMVAVGGEDATKDSGAPRLTLSPQAIEIAGIATAPVERRFVDLELRLVGEIDYDEYDKARNRPIRAAAANRTQGRAVARMGVTLDAYESDLPFLRLGQKVTFQADACPGDRFEGEVVFIDGKLDNFSRTVDVRVRVPEFDMRLKLGMLVRATVRATVGEDGSVLAPQVPGEYLCPMHAEAASPEPGRCPACNMPLHHASELGYLLSSRENATPPLVIPASAPLVTGRRAVVYVGVPDSPGTFEVREIVLGPRAGDHYVLLGGLSEGDQVVVHGGFKIDSTIQIRAKPSMMNEPPKRTSLPQESLASHSPAPSPIKASADPPPEETANEAGESGDNVPISLPDVLAAYYAVHEALSRDSLDDAVEAGASLMDTTSAEARSLDDPARTQHWSTACTAIGDAARTLADAENIDAARAAFEPLSKSVYELVSKFRDQQDRPIFRIFCPMAFNNRGADWLQASQRVQNPYFGSAMYRCGRVVETLLVLPARPRSLPGSSPSAEEEPAREP